MICIGAHFRSTSELSAPSNAKQLEMNFTVHTGQHRPWQGGLWATGRSDKHKLISYTLYIYGVYIYIRYIRCTCCWHYIHTDAKLLIPLGTHVRLVVSCSFYVKTRTSARWQWHWPLVFRPLSTQIERASKKKSKWQAVMQESSAFFSAAAPHEKSNSLQAAHRNSFCNCAPVFKSAACVQEGVWFISKRWPH
jgi:hypothetical protein